MGERALRAGEPGGVHPSRVGARRARSTLRTFSGLFPDGPRDSLAASLREYAAALGEVRDLQVLREVLAKNAEGELAEWLEAHVDRGLSVGWQRIERDLLTARHRHLHDEMSAVLLGSLSDGVNIAKCVKKARKRADKRLSRAGDSVEKLHDARKAAKRARYAAEAAGGPKEVVAHYENVQDLLGRHHDLALAARHLDDADLPVSLRTDAASLAGQLRTEAEAFRQQAIACVP